MSPSALGGAKGTVTGGMSKGLASGFFLRSRVTVVFEDILPSNFANLP